MKKSLCLILLVFFCNSFMHSQQQYGNIRGVVSEEGAGVLPGATVTLTSIQYGSRSIVTSAGGIFRFINIFPETYSLRCELPGFTTYIQERLIIRVGKNFDLNIVLKPETLEEEVIVVAESPIVDTKSTETVFNATWEMLQELPSARDPWSILQQTPGIFAARENVGGSEAGRMSGINSKGSWGSGNSFNIDGAPITDVAALGWSPRYYDFDSFNEMQIVTGGQDASQQTPGVSVNFITHRGGNRFQGNARMYFTNDKLQGDNRTQELEDLGYVGNQIDQLLDYGFQFGGPILKDKLWFWIGWGVQDNRFFTIDGYPSRLKVEGYNAKLNMQLHANNRLELAYIGNGKTSNEQNVGPNRRPEASWNLWNNGTPFFKLEDEHIFSNNFLASLKVAFTSQGWGADPVGGMDVQPARDLFTGVFSGSAMWTEVWRPDFSTTLSGNLFLENILGGSHEIKFGFIYRFFRNKSESKIPQDVFKWYWDGDPYVAYVWREWVIDAQVDRFSLYINDIFSLGRLTMNIGLRLDREKGVANETTVRASLTGPDLLPGMTFPSIDPEMIYTTFSPRLGFVYDLTGDGKTMLRGNLARYSYPMSVGTVNHINPAQQSYAGYYWKDTNGDDQVTNDELLGYPYEGVLGYSGFDPWDPLNVSSPNAIAEDLKSALTDELLVGIERELFRDFSLRATLTLQRGYRYRWMPDYDKESGKVIRNTDYIGPYPDSLTYDGTTYNYEYWTLPQKRPPGSLMENWPDYHNNYIGFEMAAYKRFSKKWMLNASFTLQKHRERYGDNGYDDPTNLEYFEGGGANYIPEWMAKISALYQLPWGFRVACFGNARQGTVYNRYLLVRIPERATAGLGATTNIYTETWGSARYPTFYNFDLNLAKDFQFGRYGKLTLQVDAFNVFNFSHTLRMYEVINSKRYEEPVQILNPRVIRFGIRYQF